MMEETVKMYRVESIDERIGAYMTDAAQLAGLCMFSEENRPGPMDDEGLASWWQSSANRYSYLFGFESIAAYLAWFDDKEGREAIDEEHVLAVYSVPLSKVRRGALQMVAHEDYMEHVEDLSTTIEELT